MEWGKDYLYHYTHFESAIKIIASGYLLFSDYKRVNDINESNGIEIITSTSLKDKEYDELLSNYKMICFSMDKDGRKGFDIPAMWGHYADRGQGVCLAFDKTKIEEIIESSNECTSNIVTYSEGNIDERLVPEKQCSLLDFIMNSRNELFFQKSKDWEYEQEYRVITFNNALKSLDIRDCLVSAIIYKLNHEKFIDSIEYKVLSRFISEFELLRYSPRISGGGSLFDMNNHALMPEIKIELSAKDLKSY